MEPQVIPNLVITNDLTVNGEGSVTINNDQGLNLNAYSTTDPHISGRVWVDEGTLKISLG